MIHLDHADRESIRSACTGAALKSSAWPLRRSVVLHAGTATASDGYRLHQTSVKALASVSTPLVMPAAELASLLRMGKRDDCALEVFPDGRCRLDAQVRHDFESPAYTASWVDTLTALKARHAEAFRRASDLGMALGRAELLAHIRSHKKKHDVDTSRFPVPFHTAGREVVWVNTRWLELAVRGCLTDTVNICFQPAPHPVIISDTSSFVALISPLLPQMTSRE